MFTGIVDHTAKITIIEPMANGLLFWIESQFSGLKLGESISVDGACLTVIHSKGGEFAVQLSPETLRLTTASEYQVGTQVNLERALHVGDSLGGHWVTGHVDRKIPISSIKPLQEFTEIRFADNSSEHQHLIIPKGSICINGVSLTVNEKTPDGFTVMIIPHTAQMTNLSELTLESTVNVEYDSMAKMIHQQVQHYLKNVGVTL